MKSLFCVLCIGILKAEWETAFEKYINFERNQRYKTYTYIESHCASPFPSDQWTLALTAFAFGRALCFRVQYPFTSSMEYETWHLRQASFIFLSLSVLRQCTQVAGMEFSTTLGGVIHTLVFVKDYPWHFANAQWAQPWAATLQS